ncbi:GNAT family N-acetyltransferase [Pontibacter korlensis]|uniref:GCN5 family acetyltransferase n=1 Tax=Pontibacter korlensis TaxID=400092 RepID=A0A0E3ZGI1_9BACT|nr:GNAT family N-acetyltransferase [Pontibacter korlensis]AKD04945.1 GCN5 family acetyltransferase [Pontibacter korlensis]
MKHDFRKASLAELPQIWDILQGAIRRRKEDGSNQWQDGYPNPEVVKQDIENGVGFVLVEGETVIGYTAVLINDEPEYANIEGKWLTNSDFVVFHRVAISDSYLGKGLASKMLEFIESYALRNHIYSIKADTNFDNVAMMKIFDKMGYVYCGEVYFRGSPRKAFEKVLAKADSKAGV